MSEIRRIGAGQRWSDVVVHNAVARWVEVAEDAKANAETQIAQVLAQIDATLTSLGSDRRKLLEIAIYLSDLSDAPTLNKLWEAWVPAGHAPIRACVGVQLGSTYRVEMIIHAAV